MSCGRRGQRSGGLIARDQWRQRLRQFGVDGLDGGARPFAIGHIQQGCAAGIAVLHHRIAGEPVVQIIMRQQYCRKTAVIFGFMLLSQQSLVP